jgi:hypothetical protein
MIGFTPLEQAALHAIFAETPELTTALDRKLDAASVTDRENTGHGFFATISVPDWLEQVESSGALRGETHARVNGLQYGLGFVLFMKYGRLNLLEGYSCGGEDTSSLPLADVTFSIAVTPFDT